MPCSDLNILDELKIQSITINAKVRYPQYYTQSLNKAAPWIQVCAASANRSQK